ncbi:GHKL domain-containing protein [Planctomycetota bacterium]|nr:GHKL domain-containing protein [Planctomycetota bacterium]
MSEVVEQVEAIGEETQEDPRLKDLAQIINAYNDVTDKLQQSHEKLKGEVLRLREELASTNAQLQRSKRLSALGEMAAGIAHEIRNPLAAIQLYASMVEEDLGGVDGEVSNRELAVDNTRKIASAVRGLNGIVNDVLSFAREIELERQDVYVVDLFDKVIESHLPGIEQAGVVVERDDFEWADVMLRVDEGMIGQAILNLVRNAVDAMSEVEGERVLRTNVELRDDEKLVVLSVRDSGSGIDEDDVDRIFNPFFTTRNAGTGLGLAIVHRIVDAHGGGIVVRNDGGAVFELNLPMGECMPSDASVEVIEGVFEDCEKSQAESCGMNIQDGVRDEQ